MVEDSTILLIKDITGYLGTFLLSLLYIPQTVWVFHTRKAQGLTWVFLGIGLLLTIDTAIYGVLLGEWPLIISNAIVFVCMILLMIAKCLWPENQIVIEEVMV